MGRVHRHADGTSTNTTTSMTTATTSPPPSHRDVGDHSGYVDSGTSRIAVLERILDENDRVAAANRRRCGPMASAPST